MSLHRRNFMAGLAGTAALAGCAASPSNSVGGLQPAPLPAVLGRPSQTLLPKGKAPLCGNSIGQDRRFMERYMPKLNSFFHYRNIDVSTLKELARRWKPEAYTSFKKAQRHTALADVHESIDELQHYRKELLSI